MTAPSHRFFLGGRDLEMLAIRELLIEAGLGDRTVDHGLAWGARASAYAGGIAASLACGETPVLIELADDLGDDFDRSRILFVDHHGARAGADRPSSLRQVFALIAPGRELVWTRWMALVEANDIGHAEGLRRLGAAHEEIRRVRDADRRAQGITPEIEAESRRAIAGLVRRDGLAIVETTAATSSAIADFLLPEYGGPRVDELLVLMPGKAGFFGAGAVIRALAAAPDWQARCWYGGALPETGFWGAPLAPGSKSPGEGESLIETIIGILRAIA